MAVDQLALLPSRLAAQGFRLAGEVEVGARRASAYRRSDFSWKWFATRIHTFVVPMRLAEPSPAQLKTAAEACHSFAVHHKGGLPRGLQTGTATMPILVVPEIDDPIAEWVRQAQPRRFAATLFPVVTDAMATSVVTNAPTFWGSLYDPFLRTLVEELLHPSA